jgi:hypothetical protein
MALQVRRGTNAERLGITPLAGELVYTTDTKQLYVGDGATAGGITSIAGTIDSLLADTTPQLGGTLDLNGNNITGTGNINITGTITASGNINLGDGIGSDIVVFGGAIQGHLVPDTDITWNLGSSTKQFNEAWISQLNVENQLTVGRIMGDLIADDSTVVFDSSTGLFVGDLTGNLTGDADGDHTGTFVGASSGTFVGASSGTFDGDMTGSIFADSSTLVIDGQTGYLTTDRITSTDNNLEIIGGSAGGNALQVRSTDDKSILRLSRTSDTDLTGQALEYGSILFERIDVNGAASRSLITGYNDGLFIYVADQNNDFLENNVLLINSDGNVGFGTFSPTAKLDVRGNAIISGFVQFGSLTYLQRDALASAAGMVIWNSDSLQFEGFNGTNWINLIDGAVSTAP